MLQVLCILILTTSLHGFVTLSPHHVDQSLYASKDDTEKEQIDLSMDEASQTALTDEIDNLHREELSIRGQLSSQPSASSLLAQVLDDIMQQDDVGEEAYLNKEDNTAAWKESRSQWKSKRYIMLKDVAKLIEKDDPEAIAQAQGVVDRLLDLDSNGGDYKPLLQAYNIWLNAIAKTCQTKNRGKQAEQVLVSMRENNVPPTVISYTIAMNCHAKDATRDSAQNAERLLFQLLEQQQYDSGMSEISSITTDAVLNAWAQQGTRLAAERAKLLLERMESFHKLCSSHSYSIVMNAFSKIGAAEEAEEILQQCIAQDDDLVDTIMYNVALNAWARSNDPRAGTRASMLLQQIHASDIIKPDVITYNSVISAWSKSGHVNAAPQAERILQLMVSTEDGPSPNTVSYNSVLHAWSKSTNQKATSRASVILEYMIRSGNDEIRPDIYSFTSVLNVLAKSKHDPQKSKKARALLDQLLLLYEKQQDSRIRPTNIAFNTVLNACAFSASFSDATRKEALQTAVSSYALLRSTENEYHSFCQPDEITYGNMLKVISNLMKSGAQQTRLGMTVMRHCMDDGLVGDMVWRQIPKCVSKAAYKNLLPQALQDKDREIELVDLPRKWRRRVKDRAIRRKSRSNDDRRKKNGPRRRVARQVIKGPRGITESAWSGKDI